MLKPVGYEDAGHALEGWLASPPTSGKPVPGIVVFHEFMGLGEYLRRPVEKLAGLGYAVLAADLYGEGVRPKDASAASRLSRPLRRDRRAMRQRAAVALDCLKRLAGVDPDNIAAVGYSLGGCAALPFDRYTVE